jgi:hypothetical protein
MFCPTCGKSEQAPDSYCRSCGTFLVDPTNSLSLVNRVLRINHPERQVKFTMTVDLVTAIVSGFLLFFMMGYFDATYKKTGIPTPWIVYLVYVFLGLVSAWQLMSFMVGAALRRKLNARKNAAPLLRKEDRESLPPADEKNAVANSITEQTTRNLNRVSRH